MAAYLRASPPCLAALPASELRPDVSGPNVLPEDQTDWEYLLSMTGEEARRNALADKDSLPMSPEQLARMRRAPNLRGIRSRLDMTQREFARQFQISVGTLRDWEQGLHVPDSAAIAYLRVIEQIPDAVVQALRDPVPGHRDEADAGSLRSPATRARSERGREIR